MNNHDRSRYYFYNTLILIQKVGKICSDDADER